MQLLGPDSDPALINNDWHVAGTKWTSVFCGIWEPGAHSERFELLLIRKSNTDHWGWEFSVWLWRFEFTIDLYDCRHWNRYKQKPIDTEADQLEYEADIKKDDEDCNEKQN